MVRSKPEFEDCKKLAEKNQVTVSEIETVAASSQPAPAPIVELKAIEEIEYKSLTELKEKVDESFTYAELRMVLMTLEA